MAARLTPALDAPIFTALTPLLGRLPTDRFPRHDDLNALTVPSLVSGGGAPIRFVPPAAPSRKLWGTRFGMKACCAWH